MQELQAVMKMPGKMPLPRSSFVPPQWQEQELSLSQTAVVLQASPCDVQPVTLD